MLDIGLGSFFLRSCLILTALSTFLLGLPLDAEAAEGAAAHNGNINPADWAHFIPQKFHAPERLVPAFSLFANNSILFSKGAPEFPHDPSRQNVIWDAKPWWEKIGQAEPKPPERPCWMK